MKFEGSRIAYLGSRVAVKVPTVERNPLKFSSSTVLAMKIALPVIEWSEAKVPLKINVPTSLQQVPRGNSTLPAKVTRLFVNSDQTAGRGLASGLFSGSVSRGKKVAAPREVVSRIKFFSPTPDISNLTRQRPARLWLAGSTASVRGGEELIAGDTSSIKARMNLITVAQQADMTKAASHSLD